MRGIDLPWSTQLIWALEVGSPGELWCGVIPGGLFHSRNSGDNWTLVRSLWDDPRRQQWMGRVVSFIERIKKRSNLPYYSVKK